MDAATLLTAFAGGAFGAAIGALASFIFCGIALIAGISIVLAGGSPAFLDVVANGPLFGPHVAFAGGVAAAAYAMRREHITDGKDIAFSLAELGRAGPLLIGGLFGLAGQTAMGLWGDTLNQYTNATALIVVVLGVAARLLFGHHGLFGHLPPGTSLRRRFRPTADEAWVPHQSRMSQAALLGVVAGLPASYATLALAEARPELGSAAVGLGFAVSAVSLGFAAVGKGVPVTHHMTLTAATAAHLSGSVLVGAAVGGAAGLLGEFWARTVQNHGDTHIDPPAGAIWTLTSVVLAAHALT
ncbi:hypothetical protein [Streptomyces sp. SHP 1-2]|uniref:hypothetical protein n=1 Tax=Streptomyces sp. SHP 1-2 TaxID=2769489 RepID=UPI002238FA90|nr:hypothetical protein [Streptomyces sp. SHP 1-2]MCW5254515.1 hypothetical protein [Streptomyces sp. SHP 1-2]